MRSRAAWFLILCLGQAPLAAWSEPDEAAIERAKDYFGKGKVAFELGRFEEAIDWFEKAYEETEYPEFLLNIAQCYKQLGKCDKAIFLYKQYSRQDNIDREGVQRLIATCEEILAAQQSQPSTGPSTPPPPPDDLYHDKTRFSLEGRALFAAGSVGSQATGGQNAFGGGIALGVNARFPLSRSFSLGGTALVDVRTSGINALGNPDNELARDFFDARANFLLMGQYILTPHLGSFGGLGVSIDPNGAGGVALRANAGALLDAPLPANMQLTASVGYELGGVEQTTKDILGCESLCLYQQLDIAVGVRVPLR